MKLLSSITITLSLLLASTGMAATRTLDVQLNRLSASTDAFSELGIAPTDTGKLSIFFDGDAVPYHLTEVDDPVSGSYDRAFYHMIGLHIEIGAFSQSFSPLALNDDIVVQDASNLGADGYSDSFSAGIGSEQMFGSDLELDSLGVTSTSNAVDILATHDLPTAELINQIFNYRSFWFSFLDADDKRHEITTAALRFSEQKIPNVPLPAGFPLVLTGMFGMWFLRRKG
jgi:hypothetical protein